MSKNRGYYHGRAGHPVARRMAMASMSVLAAGGIGLVAAPMALGQIVIPIGNFQGTNVGNSGSASANTGGNNAVGNASGNAAASAAPVGGGGLINLPISLGAPTNTSTGSANVSTAPATAVGNSSGTNVGQSNASGNQVNGFLTGQSQSAGVTNSGSASANTGGNGAVGNASRNVATQNVTGGGLIGVGVALGGPTNNSTGTANVTTGPATAVGNSAANTVSQSELRGGVVPLGGVGGPGFGGIGGVGGPGFGGPGFAGIGGIGGGQCPVSRFGSFQEIGVSNQGQAQANTGGNTAIGNQSTNVASQNVSGGVDPLIGVGLVIGGPVNNSSGTAVINTGPATAVGNSSVTNINQFEGCPQVFTVAGGRQPVFVPAAPRRVAVVQGTLARTGLDAGDLGMIGGAMLAAGMLLVASQRRRLAARHAAAPLAGFGFGHGTDDWDGAVR